MSGTEDIKIYTVGALLQEVCKEKPDCDYIRRAIKSGVVFGGLTGRMMGGLMPVKDDNYSVLALAVEGSTFNFQEFFHFIMALLDRHAPVNAVDGGGRTALSVTADRRGSADIARALIEHGADVNHRDLHGWTPLMIAAWSGNEAVAEVLVEEGAALNDKDGEGMTPLMLAVSCGNTVLAQILVSAGAYLSGRNAQGETLADMVETQTDMLTRPLMRDVLRSGRADDNFSACHEGLHETQRLRTPPKLKQRGLAS